MFVTFKMYLATSKEMMKSNDAILASKPVASVTVVLPIPDVLFRSSGASPTCTKLMRRNKHDNEEKFNKKKTPPKITHVVYLVFAALPFLLRDDDFSAPLPLHIVLLCPKYCVTSMLRLSIPVIFCLCISHPAALYRMSGKCYIHLTTLCPCLVDTTYLIVKFS